MRKFGIFICLCNTTLKANSLSVSIILFSNLSNYQVRHSRQRSSKTSTDTGTDIILQESLVSHKEKLNQVPLKIKPGRQQIR